MTSRPAQFDLSDVAAFRGIIDAVPHPIFVKDEETRFVIVNEMMCRLMEHSFDELIGKRDHDFFPADQADVFRGNDLRVLNTGETNENEEFLSDKKGNVRTIVTRKKRLILTDGSRLLVGCITDISDYRRAEALMKHHADHDPLTGLLNRRVFYEEITKAFDRVQTIGSHCAVLLLDLDRFKPVNDIYGHTAGDVVLCTIAERLKQIAGEGDLVARLGGDEFGIISGPMADPELNIEAARTLAVRVISAVERPIRLRNGDVEVSTSIGIARCGIDGVDAETLLRSADVAMYRAKQEGRASIRFFEPGMDVELRTRAALENDVRLAIEKGDIKPYYQPLIALAENRIFGFEILARWRHPDMGAIGPEVFIPIAEKLGLISKLTFSLLRNSCRDAQSWPGNYVLSLNISPFQLKDEFLPIRILEILTEANFPPDRLEIEVTEGAVISDLPAAKAIFASLRNLGIKVSLDDFGTGYSSLYHLRELSFDKIKIDRSFVQSMKDNDEATKMVNAILGLTKALGLPTTAEGIEDGVALKSMIERGCEFGQGFYFAEAVPAADVPSLLERNGGSAKRASAR